MDYYPEPFFLNANGRRLFCVRPKASGAAAERSILILPPFAEEMNRVRHYLTRVSKSLLDEGFTVLNLDLSSTGDSSGEFSEARVSHWLEDIAAAAAHLAGDANPLSILGIRGGALFLPTLLSNKALNIGKVCLLEPLNSGGQLLNEFLRVRVAKSVFEGTKETVSSLATVLENGDSLEVAGYQLSTGLYNELLELSLEDQDFCLDEPGLVIGCMRAVTDARVKKLEHAVSTWRCAANSFNITALEIEPFWANDLANVDQALDTEITNYFSNSR